MTTRSAPRPRQESPGGGAFRRILITLLPAALILPGLSIWLALSTGEVEAEHWPGMLPGALAGTALACAMVVWLAWSSGRVDADRRRLQQALENTKALLQAVIDAVPEWIYVKSGDGRLALVNRSFAAACQCPPQLLVGRLVSEFVAAAGIEGQASLLPAEAYVDPLLDNDNSRLVRVLTAAGSSRVFAVFKAELDVASGAPGQTLCYCRDVTDQRQAMQERLDLVSKLGRAQKMETIGMLSGGIAHDFNNILAAVIGYAEWGLILAPASAESSQGKIFTYLSGILQAANRAKELVRQLLSFSRSREAGEVDSAMVKPIVTEVVNLLRSTLPASIALEANIAEDLPPVHFGPVKLHQVLLNLCINARDALPGKGRILIKGAQAQLDQLQACDSCHQDFRGDYVVISVRDNGAGIARDEQANIFSPFFTTKAVGEGTGLGLSVLHGVVHAADGHVKLISERGLGSEFLVYLPSLPASVQTGVTAVSDQPPEAIQEAARILVVDDEAAVAGIFTELLALLGYQVRTLTSPIEALQLFQSDPQAFDLVITDQTMPELSGDELARALLALRPELPIILCSGYNSDVDDEAAQSLGVRRLLAKPVANATLCAAVRDCLSRETA